jgi:hypothetical protein
MTQRAIDIYEKLNKVRQEDPDAFEREANLIRNEFFDSIEDDERRLHLQQLQFRLDGELRHYKDPVARMNKMVEIFWKGVNEFQQTIGKLK